MSRAQDLITLHDSPPPEVAQLAWITRLVGIVSDPQTGDLILVGHQNPTYPEINLQDFVVALRIVFLNPEVEYPGLSLDPDTENPDSWYQKVRYIGEIRDTRFGQVCLDVDVLLKKMSMGLIPTGSQEVISTWDLQLMTNPSDEDTSGQAGTITYFYPIGFNSFVLQNAAYLEANRIVVLAEGVSSASLDPAETYFAKQLTKHFEEVACTYPVLEDLRNIMSAYALAKSIPSMTHTPNLDYWLQEYKLTIVQTPLRVRTLKRGVRGLAASYAISGQIELRTQVRLLEAGDPIALGEIALASRPSNRPLTWSFESFEDSLVFSQRPEESVFQETINRANYFFGKGEYKKAVENYNRAIELGAISAEVLCQRALALSQNGQIDLALADCNHASQLDSTDSEVLLTRARIFADQGEFHQAEYSISRALTYDPSRIETQLAFADILLKLGQYESALKQTDGVLSTHFDNGQAWLIRGDILDRLDRHDEAFEAYKKVSQSDARTDLVRSAYFLSEEVCQKGGLNPYPNIPVVFLNKKAHFLGLSLHLYPGYVFAQAYSPPEQKKWGYVDYGTVPLMLSGDVVLWNRLRFNSSTTFDIEVRRVWSQKRQIDESDTLFTDYENVHGIFGKSGYTQIGWSWLISNGMWDRPYVLFSNYAYRCLRSELSFEIYPFKRSNYDVLSESVPTVNTQWHGISSLSIDIPMSYKFSLSSSVTYERTIDLPIEDCYMADLKLRSMLSFAKEGIFMNVGSRLSQNAVFSEPMDRYRQLHFYLSIERSKNNSSEVLNLGVLINDDLRTGERTRYLLGSLQFSRRIFSIDGWF